MINCPKCGTAVRAEKAFCHNCGSPMDAAKAARETPLPDSGATVLEPPRRPAPPAQQPFAPPAVTEVQPASRPTAPVSAPPAGIAQPMPPPARRTRSRKLGVGFVLLLLFLMFLAFMLAVALD
ncbi:MAG TPA: zinc ribbon domain-containing protein [Pyrinomonadaceae bacterium]|nr:zinc ribbon domain-containing protein [Pyrinomonadaceae bacterium]